MAEENLFRSIKYYELTSTFKGSERMSAEDMAEENLLLNLLLGAEPLNKKDPLEISRYKEDPLEILEKSHLLGTEALNKEDPREIFSNQEEPYKAGRVRANEEEEESSMPPSNKEEPYKAGRVRANEEEEESSMPPSNKEEPYKAGEYNYDEEGLFKAKAVKKKSKAVNKKKAKAVNEVDAKRKEEGEEEVMEELCRAGEDREPMPPQAGRVRAKEEPVNEEEEVFLEEPMPPGVGRVRAEEEPVNEEEDSLVKIEQIEKEVEEEEVLQEETMPPPVGRVRGKEMPPQVVSDEEGESMTWGEKKAEGVGRVRANEEEEESSMPPQVVSEPGHLHYCRLLLEVAKLNPKT